MTPDAPVVSVLRIDRRHQQARAEMHDVHCAHQRVLHATDGHPQVGRLLWAQPDRWTLVIQSGLPVTDAAFPAGFLAEWTSRVVTRPTGGQAVRFSLAGAASVYRRGKRLRSDDPDGWLARKLEGLVDDLEIVSSTRRASRTGIQRASGNRLSLAEHMWTGRAFVADADGLWEAMTNGVGAGKAFGLGLLLVVSA